MAKYRLHIEANRAVLFIDGCRTFFDKMSNNGLVFEDGPISLTDEQVQFVLKIARENNLRIFLNRVE